MATDSRGHTVPAGTGHPARADILSLSKSIRDIAVVANVTARAALITALTADSLGPSTSNPVYVFRTDAGTGLELEFTVDGTNWRTIRSGTPHASYTVTVTPSSGTVALGSTGAAAGNWGYDGEYVEGWGSIKFGGTGINPGTGSYAMPLPVACLASLPSNADVIGQCSLFDASSGIFYSGYLTANTTTSFRAVLHGQTGVWGQTATPATPADGDRLNFKFRYPVA